MKFPSEKRMKNRELFVNIYEDLKTKKNGLTLVDVELNSEFLYADESYDELHVYRRPYKDSGNNIVYANEALYTDYEINEIKDIAFGNNYKVYDDSKLISTIYAVKADLIYSKIMNLNFVKIDVDTLKESSKKIDESSIIKQYNYNVFKEANTQVLFDMLDYDLAFKLIRQRRVIV